MIHIPDASPDFDCLMRTGAKYGLQMHLDRLGELAQKYSAPPAS